MSVHLSFMKNIIVLLFMFCACNRHHNTAAQIYLSGNVGDISNWTLSSYDSAMDRDTLRYRYDTALFLLRGHFSPNNKEKIQGTMFYYKNKPEGRSYVCNEDGSLSAACYYVNGKLEGDFVVYGANRKVKAVTVYKNGIAISDAKYNDDGSIK